MIASEWLEQIVFVPVNGLGNRLEAWASAAILAAELDVPLKVLWEPEPACSAPPSDLFAESLVRRLFVSRAYVDGFVGMPHEDLPRYLNVIPAQRLVTLAGHDLGEQHFMSSLEGALADTCKPTTLLIIAGGLFYLPNSEHFDRQREVFYRQLSWSPALNAARDAQAGAHAPYAALHIRQTDRSLEAPTPRTVRKGLSRLAELVPERELFVAADTAEGRERWSREAERLGFSPWHASHDSFDRTAEAGSLAAALDWLLLAGANGIAYPAASTFSAEAVVAAGASLSSVPMVASRATQRMRHAQGVTKAAVSLPVRRLRASGRNSE